MDIKDQEISLEEIDDFLAIPGSENVEDTSEKNVFSNDAADAEVIDEPTDKNQKPEDEDPDRVLNLEEDPKDETSDSEKTSKNKLRSNSKTGSEVSAVFSKLIEDKIIVPFDDEKPIADYTADDYKELLQANYEDIRTKERESVHDELKENLPEDLKYAIKYVEEGGKDLKLLFRQLSAIKETEELNPDADAATIVKQYYQLTKPELSEEEIDTDVRDLEDTGKLEKRAEMFKPKLIEKRQQMIDAQITKQENLRKTAMQMRQKFTDNVYDALKASEISGSKIDKQTRDYLFTELTDTKYKSVTGRPTNLLGKLIEEYQYSEKPRFDLIAEATWLLSKPDEYKAHIAKNAKNETIKNTVRTLKTEESRHIGNSNAFEEDESSKQRTVKRQVNIFKRS